MAVDTNPIPDIVPGRTTIPEAIASANDAFDRIWKLSLASNAHEIDIGDKTTLKTAVKTDLVSAINEIYDDFLDGFLLQKITGNLLDLTTTAKNNLVAAINEQDKEIGDLNALKTSTKTSLVAAINSIAEASTSIGDLSELLTQDRFTLVGSINEIYKALGFIGNLATDDDNVISAVNRNFTNVGDLTALLTQNKTNLVVAINELKNRADGFIKADGSNSPTADMDWGGKRLKNLGLATSDTDAVTRGQVQEIARVGNLDLLQTQTKSNLVAAINELVINSGNLTALKTTEKGSIVGAINELYDNIGYSDKQENLELVTTVNFGRGVGTDRNQTFNFFASATVTDYDFRIQRAQGSNGVVTFDNKGTGNFNFGFTGANKVRIQNSTTEPLQVQIGTNWKTVALAGDYLPIAGGTITGPLGFNQGLSTNGSFAIIPGYTNRTGWIEGRANDGTRLFFFGNVPTTGTEKWIELTAENGTLGLNITGRLKVSDLIETSNDISGLSDSRLKSDVVTLKDALKMTLSMRGVSYVMNGKPGTGVIAQELEAVDPTLVHTNEEGIKSVKYMQLAGYFIEAIKELKREKDYEIELLRKEISELKSLIKKPATREKKVK
uniref:Tail fiber protein n=1 Tax=Ochrobactrum phage ORM_20 TaxID=2985243 RepID=A0A9N6ZFZ6_9VIRU|nr:tail fiber protein [Ochrobactrum phage ORM_20]